MIVLSTETHAAAAETRTQLDAELAEVELELVKAIRDHADARAATRRAIEANAVAGDLLQKLDEFSLSRYLQRRAMPSALAARLNRADPVRRAQGEESQARQRLENVQWRADDLRDGIERLIELMAPGPNDALKPAEVNDVPRDDSLRDALAQLDRAGPAPSSANQPETAS